MLEKKLSSILIQKRNQLNCSVLFVVWCFLKQGLLHPRLPSEPQCNCVTEGDLGLLTPLLHLPSAGGCFCGNTPTSLVGIASLLITPISQFSNNKKYKMLNLGQNNLFKAFWKRKSSDLRKFHHFSLAPSHGWSYCSLEYGLRTPGFCMQFFSWVLASSLSCCLLLLLLSGLAAVHFCCLPGTLI